MGTPKDANQADNSPRHCRVVARGRHWIAAGSIGSDASATIWGAQTGPTRSRWISRLSSPGQSPVPNRTAPVQAFARQILLRERQPRMHHETGMGGMELLEPRQQKPGAVKGPHGDRQSAGHVGLSNIQHRGLDLVERLRQHGQRPRCLGAEIDRPRPTDEMPDPKRLFEGLDLVADGQKRRLHQSRAPIFCACEQVFFHVFCGK